MILVSHYSSPWPSKLRALLGFLAIGLTTHALAAEETGTFAIGSFEADEDGFDGALLRDAATAKVGQTSGKLVNRDQRSVSTSKDFANLRQNFDVLSFWLRSLDAGKILLRMIDGTGQTFQQPVTFASDGGWHEIKIDKFDRGQSWGGAGDKKWHGPPRTIGFLLETNGTVWIDGISATLSSTVIHPDFQWAQARLGNIFQLGEPVELPVDTQADELEWNVTDYWRKVLATGTSPARGFKAVIQPRVTSPGYYLVHATPRKGGQALKDHFTSFAIVRPHQSVDPLRGPFGVMTHFAQGMNVDMLPLFKKIGIDSVRDEHSWQRVEQTRGVYEFPPQSDRYMNACKKVGINPLIVMAFGNKLHDKEDGPSTPAGFAAYGKYGEAILKQYGDQIHWLEIWNEYNGTWCPQAARADRPKYYAEMLKVAYERIKAVRPDVEVLGCAAVVIPLPYLEGIFKHDGLKYMDGVVIHPYRAKPEGVDKEVAQLQALIRKYNGGRDKPIWVTETGHIGTSEYDWEAGRKMYEKGRAEGARYLARQYTLLLKQKVARIYWYLGADHREFVSMGLLRQASDASEMGRYAVAPAYVSYANLIHQLDGAQFVEREAWQQYTRSHVYLFRRGNEEIRVCWATQPSKIRVTTSQPLTVFDLMGGESRATPTGGETVFDLTEDAVYIRGPASKVAEIDSGVRVVAASGDDYSKTQGENDWYYGYFDGKTRGKEGAKDRDGAGAEEAFHELKQVETVWGYNWGGVSQSLSISQGGMHPDKIGGKDAAPVLRWKSSVEGKIEIQGYWANKGAGDGVLALILVDGKQVYSQLVGGKHSQRVEVALPVTVKKGSLVDFLCKPNANTLYDATGYEFRMIQTR